MEIDDPEDGESFGDIEPEQAFHDWGTGLFWSIKASRARMEIRMRPGDPRRREISNKPSSAANAKISSLPEIPEQAQSVRAEYTGL